MASLESGNSPLEKDVVAAKAAMDLFSNSTNPNELEAAIEVRNRLIKTDPAAWERAANELRQQGAQLTPEQLQVPQAATNLAVESLPEVILEDTGLDKAKFFQSRIGEGGSRVILDEDRLKGTASSSWPSDLGMDGIKRAPYKFHGIDLGNSRTGVADGSMVFGVNNGLDFLEVRLGKEVSVSSVHGAPNGVPLRDVASMGSLWMGWKALKHHP